MIFYLLRTGCQWRLPPREHPPCSTVHHYLRTWKNAGVWDFEYEVQTSEALTDVAAIRFMLNRLAPK